jgi:hypothetical protein
MRNLSKEQKDQLLKSKSVVSVSESQVVYSPDFKKLAIRLRNEGMHPHDIFIEGDLDLDFIDFPYMRKTIDRWCDLHDQYGDDYFKVETRGTNKKPKLDNNDLDNWTDEDLKTLILVYEQMVEDLGKKKASTKK